MYHSTTGFACRAIASSFSGTQPWNQLNCTCSSSRRVLKLRGDTSNQFKLIDSPQERRTPALNKDEQAATKKLLAPCSSASFFLEELPV
jgi:hypothetical protein